MSVRALPGINPRPSLNGDVWRHTRNSPASVAGDKPPALIERGVYEHLDYLDGKSVAGDKPPALIERWRRWTRWWQSSSVAGDKPPALIERTHPGRTCSASPALPGINPRPSLNESRTVAELRAWYGVAGDKPPALIERSAVFWWDPAGPAALPGINPRPSLNAIESVSTFAGWRRALPGINPRPSLNAPPRNPGPKRSGCVAGDKPPALIERFRRFGCCARSPGVAGDKPPALIERRPPKKSPTRVDRRCRG